MALVTKCIAPVIQTHQHSRQVSLIINNEVLTKPTTQENTDDNNVHLIKPAPPAKTTMMQIM